MGRVSRVLACFALLTLLAGCGASIQPVQPVGKPAADRSAATRWGEEKLPRQLPDPYQDDPVIREDDYLYFLRVNTTCNTVTVYAADEEDRYSQPVKAMICSTGADTPRDRVIYLYGKNRWEWLGLVHGVCGRYVTQIEGSILFHSVPYEEWWDNGSLQYEEFDKLGTSASAGCVRLQIADALWIYQHKYDIEAVEFYDDPVPGPLGRPEAPKISHNLTCRNWDPTDPDPASPWHSYEPVTPPVQDEVMLSAQEPGVPQDAGTPPEAAESMLPEDEN
ncbi:MAG: L,D-transpeptidase [Oscillospiraceae bacterium]|nr:L,D-transpeptidase [Oscillospiraceae bacterium]